MLNGNRHTCRVCGKADLEVFLDLGNSPLADRLLTKAQLEEKEPMYPLQVAFCRNCTLVQILETVDPEELFCRDYPYYSSVSSSLLEHSRQNVLELIARRRLGPQSFVVELASNDGYLLRNYVDVGIPCLGIDPAQGPAQAAERIGVPTRCTFFNEDLARSLCAEGKKADVIHANNVLAHVADTNGFVEGIRQLLRDDGVAVIEVPYVKNLIDHCEFDTIYHQHLCYFSVTALDHLFRRHDLYLNEVRPLAIHGGSLRLYVEPHEAVTSSVRDYLADEKACGADTFEYYCRFAQAVANIKDRLRSLLTSLKSDQRRIMAYAAAAKGCTLLNYVGIDRNWVEAIVDKNPHKQGKYMTGMHQPILPTEQVLERMPDYLLLLAWNFKDEIMSQQREYVARGGRFIIPIPEPVIV
ncbi:MAG TPA: class I SAM-dependent methyltransferase [Sedimentisphaerales bacterium]|nr:class I SAM-dependent methyltransferase [Sedimentisphaerales bacterium]HRS12887.1 class I SAM-dependent methyltransferase [Sedimentisphaerales bacterium]HRV49511.1 class I SAM-dependent methyltransferase [Sedimentisphaerales bacterium]